MLSVLQREKILSVRQLAKLIYASDSSVRRDINSLERAGCMIKTYGSIMLAEYKTGVVPVCFREKSDSPEKEQAAKEAAAQIFEGATVFWDALSTVRRVRKYLNSLDQLTVITNDLQIFEEFSNPKISLYCTGGRYAPPKTRCFFCSGAEAFVHSVFADLFFSQAISPSGEISDSSEEGTVLRRAMLRRSAKKYFFAMLPSLGSGKRLFYVKRSMLMLLCVTADSHSRSKLEFAN